MSPAARRLHHGASIMSLRICMLLLALGLCAGCQPQTIVTSTAVAEAATHRPPMTKMLVLAAAMGPGDRSAVETTFANELRAHGVDAHPAAELFPTRPTDKDQARQVLAGSGYDGVLIVALASVTKEQCGDIGWCTHDRGGYMVTDEYVTLESTLWDLRSTDEIVWAAGTETVNPSNQRQLVHSASQVVIPELARAKFI